MERVYEEVSRRKSQVVASSAAPRGSSDTDSSATPPAAEAPMSLAATAAAAENEGVRCTLQNYSLPRPKDRKRPRDGVRRVGFTTPPHPARSVSSLGHTAERRRRRREKASRRSSNDSDKGATLLDVDDATVQYIDAVLVKPDAQVFNKYTRFFLDSKLETLYQDFTAIFWFGRARWHVAVWMAVHLFVNLVFYALPSSGFTGMEQFILSYDSLPTIFQWIYIPIALPFAALPNKYNPFQTRWRSWVCLIIIFFNLTFQVWLADASRLATNAYTTIVDEQISCEASNSELTAVFAGLNESSSDGGLSNATIDNALAYLDDEQKNLAISVTHMCSDALVQTLVGFASLFSFLFVISIRLEFVQVVVVAVTGGAIYAIVVSAFGLQLQWLVTFAYGMAVVLLLILSYSSDRTNRRSFLSNFLVEKENENLKSSLKQAEAALQNDAAHADEERAVARVMAAPEMRHLEMVHIPFADLTFLQAIGRGSMGDVIKAKYFGTIVVCKRMRREHIVESVGGRNRIGSRDASNGDSALANFRDEIELMSCLRHPNIVQFIGASWDNASNLCIVMEYLENGDMHSVLHSGLGKNFTWADPLLKMAVDAVQGMLYLHSQERPVVHRDLKSVNILCSATFGCKVGDFGLSRRYKKGVDALTTLVGTPFWLAPEIIRSERYGPEADVYSFGIVLTELETRRTPYHDLEDTGLKVLMRVAHKGLRPSLPPSCLPERRKLIEDCLRDTPIHRPTFAQVLARLQGPVLLEIEGHVAAQPELERRVLLRRYQERRSL
ncbi:TKL/DRK protein kinase [Phytophthora megakarya]|uniref:TKL/DRK protein kinase n=1 Tax=Phytophthora megakarya TaxID=4795 RepID=A0A225V2T4_9STRA|nr:TKL/DRK protein kinase [Phytophthora megakarya]